MSLPYMRATFAFSDGAKVATWSLSMVRQAGGWTSRGGDLGHIPLPPGAPQEAARRALAESLRLWAARIESTPMKAEGAR